MVEHPLSAIIDARHNKAGLRLEKPLEAPLAPACKRADALCGFGLGLLDSGIGDLAGEPVGVGCHGLALCRFLLVFDGLLLDGDSLLLGVGQVYPALDPPQTPADCPREDEVEDGLAGEGFHHITPLWRME